MSFMTDWALNQTARWRKHLPEKDEWGDDQYGNAQEIRCRFTPGEQTVKDLMGNAIHVDFSMIADEEVSPGDLLQYGGVTYGVSGYSEPHWVGGEYIGRFSYGNKTVVKFDGG
jgi:hypothetical protein